MVEIRKFKKEDNIDMVSRVYALSWKSAYRGIIPDEYLDSIEENRWSSILEGEKERLLVALDDEKIVGASTFRPSEGRDMSDCGEIISIYLMPSHYNRGVGSILLKASIDELQKSGCQRIYLWAFQENLRAEKFYKHHGFRLTGDVKTDNIGGKELKIVKYIRSTEEK